MKMVDQNKNPQSRMDVATMTLKQEVFSIKDSLSGSPLSIMSCNSKSCVVSQKIFCRQVELFLKAIIGYPA